MPYEASRKLFEPSIADTTHSIFRNYLVFATVLVAPMSVACNASKAARANPVESLKVEQPSTLPWLSQLVTTSWTVSYSPSLIVSL